MQNEKNPPLFFRVDADEKIGSGHFMRCLALGQHWKSRGGEVVFISHLGIRVLAKNLEFEGFDWIPVSKPHPVPDDLEQALSKLSQTASWPDGGSPWLILDGYKFDGAYQEAIQGVGRLAVIDDYNHLPRYHSNILINQNIYAERIEYCCDPGTVVLAGLPYVILRSDFLNRTTAERGVPDKASRLLVTMGGGNQVDTILTILGALERVNIPELEVKLVIGLDDSMRERLTEAVTAIDNSRGVRVELVQGTDMPSLMAWSDMALTACGSTCWELAYMGIPAIVIVLADNQAGIAEGLAEAGITEYLGRFDTVNNKDLIHAIESLAFDYSTRRRRSIQARKLVDGRGASRILDVLEGWERETNASIIHG